MLALFSQDRRRERGGETGVKGGTGSVLVSIQILQVGLPLKVHEQSFYNKKTLNIVKNQCKTGSFYVTAGFPLCVSL